MKMRAGGTLLFIGDSITDCGRARPVGEGNGLGNGYVNLVNALLAANCPTLKLRLLNTGISGNRVIDLDARWKTDMLDLKPDVLAIMIGINDVWRQFDSPLNRRQVSPEEFRRVYSKLLKSARRVVKNIAIMPPYYIEASKADPMRKMMDEYGRIARKLAKEHGAVFADVQAAFDAYLLHNPTQSLCGDRVHPNLNGHMIIAKCFLDAVGFEWM